MILKRSGNARLLGLCGALATAALFYWRSDVDCSTLRRHRSSCQALQAAWPLLAYGAAWAGVVALAGLFDPRPYLVMNGEGIRFRWAGFIPWRHFAAAEENRRAAGKWGAELGLRLVPKDRKALNAQVRRHGETVQKVYFALQSVPLLGPALIGPFGRIGLVGTGVGASFVIGWINERIAAADGRTGA